MKNFLFIILLTLFITGCNIRAIIIEIDQAPVDVSEIIDESEDIE